MSVYKKQYSVSKLKQIKVEQKNRVTSNIAAQYIFTLISMFHQSFISNKHANFLLLVTF